jgi:hypothetical protein
VSPPIQICRSVVTIPGAVFFLPNEASARVAGVIVEAIGKVSSVG